MSFDHFAEGMSTDLDLDIHVIESAFILFRLFNDFCEDVLLALAGSCYLCSTTCALQYVLRGWLVMQYLAR